MKKIIYFFFLFISFSVVAQPTITSSWVGYPGVRFKGAGFNAFVLNEGSAGASQTWDFSTLDTSNSFDASYIIPSTGASSSKFPGATECLSFYSGVDIEYYKLNGNVYQTLGAVQPSNSFITYSDPQDIFHFPITYNSTFSDGSRAIQITQSPRQDTVLTTANTTETADGYGTLITKGGTFSNVIRLHMTNTARDSNFRTRAITKDTNNTYIWIAASHPGNILATISHYSKSSGGGSSGYYTFNGTTGINDISIVDISHWSIVPQPALHSTHILIDNNGQNKTARVVIYDLLGKEIMSTEHTLNAGSNNVEVNVSALSDGIYIASLEVQGLSSSQKLVVSRR